MVTQTLVLEAASWMHCPDVDEVVDVVQGARNCGIVVMPCFLKSWAWSLMISWAGRVNPDDVDARDRVWRFALSPAALRKGVHHVEGVLVAIKV
jgi:hypothetical protein